MKRILITGGAGFAASHLIKLLLQEDNCEIHATKRVRSDMYRPQKMDIIDRVKWHLIELTDAHSVRNVISKVMPDQIYHLAAQDYVKSSWDSPHETFDTNVGGLINLYQAIRDYYPSKGHYIHKTPTNIIEADLIFPKVLVTSTSETYGFHDKPIYEHTIQTPLNPYGISKMTMDKLAQLYAKAYHIPTVITRAFNITGWGRNDPFVDSNFAKQIVEIEKGKRSELRHGNLGAKRSFFDVKDAVRGYQLAMNHKLNSDYEIFCFGPEKSTSIKEMLQIMVDVSGVKVNCVNDDSRKRPVDTPDMRCDATKAMEVLGWTPTIPLEESLRDLIEYWRERLN